MSQKCEYYFIEEYDPVDNTPHGDRNPRYLGKKKKALCTHSDSKHALGMLVAGCPCEGNQSKCVIPHVWDNNQY